MTNRSVHAAYFNVSVIGLSGDEETRGSIGVGKSCLCNRFVRPDEDSYYSDHIYMLSQSDYGGEVVNNVPWLYWGEATRVNPENDQQNWIFRVIEQTEFIDDAAFTLLSHGSNESYIKRCLNLKLKSARKLMYICKDQLGIEADYRKEYLPDGKINIDGFLLVFDVSARDRSADRQWEFLREVFSSMPKGKRRFVIVTTKNDMRCEEMRNELDRFLARREFRTVAGNVPIVDTSAEKGINVDSAFLMLGSLIEKSRTKPRVILYIEAERAHDETMERLSNNLREKLALSVTNHRTNWQEWSRRQDRNLHEFFSVLGTRNVKRLFDEHVHTLKETFLSDKLKWYLQELPKALDDLIPNVFQNSSLDDLIQYISRHERFDRWFIQTFSESNLSDLIDNGDKRIPFNLLYYEDAAIILGQHNSKLMKAEARKVRRKAFMSLLRRNKSVKAGKELTDVSVFFAGEECFDGLSVSDRLEVYMRYQEELTSRSKQEFQELLLERSDLFFKLALPQTDGDHMTRSMTMSQDELLLRQLCESMQNHGHYRNFDYLPKDRQEMIYNHLNFFRLIAASPPALFPASTDYSRPVALCAAPTFDCPASPCVQSRLVDHLSSTLTVRNTPSVLSRPLHVIGQAPWSTFVASALQTSLSPFQNCHFNFEFHTPSYVIRPTIFVHELCRSRPPSIQENALILLVYRDAASIHLLEQCAVHVQHSSTGDNCIVLHLCDVTVLASEEVDILRLRGGQLAIQVKGYFAEMQLQSDTRFRPQSQLHQMPSNTTGRPTSVDVESLHLWNCLDNALHAACRITPKLTIIIASMCGDLFSPNLVMKSVVTDSTRFAPWKQRLYIGDGREIILSSYFQLLQLRTGTLPGHVHGLILIFWTARKASFAAMKAVSEYCPTHWPKLFVGVGVNGREDCLQDGQQLAHDLDSSFIHIQPENTDHRARFDAFLHTCMGSKPVTEKQNRPLLGHRRQMNHPCTLPPPPPPNAAGRGTGAGAGVVRRKSSAGTNGPRAAVGGLSSRKSWHSSNSGQDEGLIYSEPNPISATGCGGQRSDLATSTTDPREKKKGTADRDVNGTSRGAVEDEYSCPYDFPHGSSPERRLVNDDSKTSQPTPLSTLNSNSQDGIYSEPLDIDSFAAQQKLGQTINNQGGPEAKIIISSTCPQPFDVENVYAEVEGFNPNESQIRHIVAPKRHSPSPPPPFPRTTSEADPQGNPWMPRFIAPSQPEYDEPPRDLDPPPPPRLDRATCGYQSHDEEVVTERVRRRSGGLLSRHNSERRSHKESKKKTRSSERSGNAGASASSTSGAAASSSGGLSKWLTPFRSGSSSSSSANTGRAPSATRNQTNSPRVQPPPPPGPLPHPTDAFVKSCMDFIERPGGLQTQGIYRECGNRTTAESIRQRSKDGYILDWLIFNNVTPHDVATALKLYLRDLPEPVVPLSVKIWREIAGESSPDIRISRLRQALCTIPLPNQRLFYHLISHFRKVTDFSNVNDMTASNLAICWTPTLLIPKNADMTVLLTMKPIQDLLAFVIELADNIFLSVPC